MKSNKGQCKKLSSYMSKNPVRSHLPFSAAESLPSVIIKGITTDQSVGRDVFASAPFRVFNNYLLAHIYSGQGRLQLANGKEYHLPTGCTVFLTPGTANRYGSIPGDEPYYEDYAYFDGSLIADMLNSNLLAPGIGFIGTPRRLQALATILNRGTPDAAWRAGLELQSILLDSYQNRTDRSQHSQSLQLLFHSLQASPESWWSIREMADFCNLSESQFRRTFLAETGMLPKNYVERNKLEAAARQLVETTRTIDEIALSLGYRDRYHFSKRFKNFFDIPPVEYRKKNRSQNDAG